MIMELFDIMAKTMTGAAAARRLNRKLFGSETVIARNVKIDSSMVAHYATALDLSYGAHDYIPPTFIVDYSWEQETPVENGRASHDLDFVLPNMTMVRAGNDYEFYKRVSIGDHITVKRKIIKVFSKVGKKNKNLIFVVSRLQYYNSRQEKLATNVETFVFV